MSITLTNEQFTALLDNSLSKKFSKADLLKRTNAMDIKDFINKINAPRVSKLVTMELPDFIVFTIKEHMETLEEEELPFVCANSQTKAFYYKENGEWIKGNDFVKKIYNKIHKNCIDQLLSKYKTQQQMYDDDDEATEQQYSKTLDCEKQQILCNLCNVDKYPYDKVIDKVLYKLGRHMKGM
jgi:hypothetical protein